MWRFTAFVASAISVAKFDRVSEALSFEASHGIWNVNVDVVTNVTSEQGGRQSGGLKRDTEEAGVTSLSVFEGSQAAHV